MNYLIAAVCMAIVVIAESPAAFANPFDGPVTVTLRCEVGLNVDLRSNVTDGSFEGAYLGQNAEYRARGSITPDGLVRLKWDFVIGEAFNPTLNLKDRLEGGSFAKSVWIQDPGWGSHKCNIAITTSYSEWLCLESGGNLRMA